MCGRSRITRSSRIHRNGIKPPRQPLCCYRRCLPPRHLTDFNIVHRSSTNASTALSSASASSLPLAPLIIPLVSIVAPLTVCRRSSATTNKAATANGRQITSRSRRPQQKGIWHVWHVTGETGHRPCHPSATRLPCYPAMSLFTMLLARGTGV